MAFEILYYGADTSHRVSVLTAAGYAIENCQSAAELARALESSEAILAVLFMEENGAPPHDVIPIVRERCSAPLILFRDSAGYDDASDFDFIIPNLTPPTDWLQEIASQIEQRRHSGSPAQAQPSNAIPYKIRLVERENAASKASEIDRLGPPPDHPAPNAGPYCLN